MIHECFFDSPSMFTSFHHYSPTQWDEQRWPSWASTALACDEPCESTSSAPCRCRTQVNLKQLTSPKISAKLSPKHTPLPLLCAWTFSGLRSRWSRRSLRRRLWHRWRLHRLHRRHLDLPRRRVTWIAFQKNPVKWPEANSVLAPRSDALCS